MKHNYSSFSLTLLLRKYKLYSARLQRHLDKGTFKALSASRKKFLVGKVEELRTRIQSLQLKLSGTVAMAALATTMNLSTAEAQIVFQENSAKNPLKVAALHAAVAGRNMEIVKAVLAAGGDPNAQQQAGFRPMHEAGGNANRALAELLLAHGADPSLTTDDGKSAIDLAREKGHAEFADWLATWRRP